MTRYILRNLANTRPLEETYGRYHWERVPWLWQVKEMTITVREFAITAQETSRQVEAFSKAIQQVSQNLQSRP